MDLKKLNPLQCLHSNPDNNFYICQTIISFSYERKSSIDFSERFTARTDKSFQEFCPSLILSYETSESARQHNGYSSCCTANKLLFLTCMIVSASGEGGGEAAASNYLFPLMQQKKNISIFAILLL